ncbi:hypothetical protein [Streptomyces bacillaris]|uniref:hypothetical protein n=1 Tax=Streptomyces bacillaris TaxID=68179 RepID=UPI003467C67D
MDDVRWRMPSMRAVMESRERTALARVEELRAEFERVRAALADAEEVLNRRVIGLEEYLETLTQLGGPAPAEASEPSEPEPVREPVVDDAAAPSTARARRAVTDCRRGKWRWAWVGTFRFRPGWRVRGVG